MNRNSAPNNRSWPNQVNDLSRIAAMPLHLTRLAAKWRTPQPRCGGEVLASANSQTASVASKPALQESRL
jgi:hypothetical protein